jgi:CheY-like chemotaxis protein
LKACGDHLLSLVNDVLDLAKLEAGKLTLNPARCEIADLLQQTAELLSPRAHAKGLEIAWASPRGLPPVLADEGRLRQVLLNLAGNAVKFTETGGVLLSVEATAASADTVRLRLTVRDTGPGVPVARQKAIFEAFTHADDADQARPDGAGLGLSIVRRLAEAHDGHVGVDSTLGDGATFWFEADYPLAGKAAAKSPLKGVTVVIASPSAILRDAASLQVRTAGGRPVACLTLEEAAARAPAGSVVLVDGALGRGVPVRPVAGRPSLILLPPEGRAGIGRSRKAGFDGYLIKPLRQTSLVSRVLAALGADSKLASRDDERAEAVAARGARVLLVEDNPVNALLARKLLEREGCEVDHAATAEEAMLCAVASDYTLILMDRRLPRLDGMSAAARLRALGVVSPIVALTADAFEEDRRACLAAGMDDFLTKPLDPGALRAILARAQAGTLGRDWTKPRRDAKVSA